MSAVNMCVGHVPFLSGHSQLSALFSAAIMFPLFILEGILCKDIQSNTFLTCLLLTSARELKWCLQSWLNEKVERGHRNVSRLLIIGREAKEWRKLFKNFRKIEEHFMIWIFGSDYLKMSSPCNLCDTQCNKHQLQQMNMNQGCKSNWQYRPRDWNNDWTFLYYCPTLD